MRLSSPRRPAARFSVTTCLLAALVLSCRQASALQAPTAAQVLQAFSSPGREYASAPLWVWNDRLTEEQVRGTLRDLAGQKVMQAFVHPRPGLMTPYLSEEWFRLWKAALDEARKLDMNIWIYDENSYPSGFAGGFVPDAMPESRGKGLVLEEAASPPAWGDSTLAVHRLTDAGFEDASADAKAGKPLAAGRYMVARIALAGASPWHGGKWYVDLLQPGVTEKFLEITLGAYQREVGDEFGKRIPGIFTDEPELVPAGGLPWTDGLPALFAKRWGYDLVASLPCLVRPLGDWKKVRHDYWRLLLELFIDRWGRPYYQACEKAGLEFTGHYWEHEWPRCAFVPDNMAMYAWHQRPAIDILMNQYDEGTHAQFGNARVVRELASVANQLTRRRTLCEAYGAAGWELRFQDMKRIADWLFALGVNTIDEHLSYVTIRGARKKDHPQSFSYHAPWWNDYHVRATYAARLSAALSMGEQVQPFLLLEPTTTAWLYQADSSHAGKLEELGNEFQKLVTQLEAAQVEYDIGCEDIIARNGSVTVRRLKVGKRAYRAVIIPPGTETIEARTAELLEELSLTGGTVVSCCDVPPLVEGRPASGGPRAPGEMPVGWERTEPNKLPEVLARIGSDGFSVRRAAGDPGILFHHRRRLSDGELVFLANTSDANPSAGSIVSPARGAERWDIETGQVGPVFFREKEGVLEVPFELPPCGSALYLLTWEPRQAAPERKAARKAIAPVGPMAVRRTDPNVLAIDFVDVTAGGETLERAHVYRAGQFAFRKNGMERNPWDSAVQFRDELITRKFPPESGLKVTYRFAIRDGMPDSLWVVVERPDLYKVRLNGKEVAAEPGAWWLDRAFGKISARTAARVGENVLELEASPFTIYHEIEAAYVIGEFGVEPAESGFAIVPDRNLAAGWWKEQALPLYGAGVAYRQEFDIAAPSGRHVVRLPAWNGSVARVMVNGRLAGHIEAPPYEREIGALLVAGKNTVEVVVIGTLKNTLGPHHAGPGLGSAWPGMFHQAPEKGPPPGSAYATVGYGLGEPFVLAREE